jgi:hypothetical protein
MALLGAILPIVGSYLSSEIDLERAAALSVAAIVAYLASQGYVDGKRVEGVLEPVSVALKGASDADES